MSKSLSLLLLISPGRAGSLGVYWTEGDVRGEGVFKIGAATAY